MGDKKGAQPGNQNARKAEGENEGDESKNVTFDSDRGNAATYRVAKLKRDHPEVAERMKAGEFKSVAQAERAAGVRPPLRPGANAAFTTASTTSSTSCPIRPPRREETRDIAQQAQPVARPGRPKKQVEEKVAETKKGYLISKNPNAADRRTAKLAKSHPEIVERMKAGEFKSVAEVENEPDESKNVRFDFGNAATYRVAKL